MQLCDASLPCLVELLKSFNLVKEVISPFKLVKSGDTLYIL